MLTYTYMLVNLYLRQHQSFAVRNALVSNVDIPPMRQHHLVMVSAVRVTFCTLVVQIRSFYLQLSASYHYYIGLLAHFVNEVLHCANTSQDPGGDKGSPSLKTIHGFFPKWMDTFNLVL